MLAEKLASAKVANDFGLLPLHIAAFYGYVPIIKYLLQRDDKAATLNQPNIHGLTPLHAAIIGCQAEAVKLLQESGADANIKDHRNLTPNWYACQK